MRMEERSVEVEDARCGSVSGDERCVGAVLGDTCRVARMLCYDDLRDALAFALQGVSC